MSWQIINEILGLAATDEAFAQELLANPLIAVKKRGYHLRAKEREAFRLSASDSLATFSQNVLRYFSNSDASHEESCR